jgi:hypothetical protein
MAVTFMVVVGAVLGHLYNRWAKRQSDPGFAERLGVLAATGFIVGDSLFNVVFAGLVAGSDDPELLALIETAPWQTPVGVLLFAGIIAWLYAWTRRRAAIALEPLDPEMPPQARPR